MSSIYSIHYSLLETHCQEKLGEMFHLTNCVLIKSDGKCLTSNRWNKNCLQHSSMALGHLHTTSGRQFVTTQRHRHSLHIRSVNLVTDVGEVSDWLARQTQLQVFCILYFLSKRHRPISRGNRLRLFAEIEPQTFLFLAMWV